MKPVYEKALTVFLPEDLKYRLDRYVLENKSTLKETVANVLDKTLPKYDQE